MVCPNYVFRPTQFASVAIDPSGEMVAAGCADTFEICLYVVPFWLGLHHFGCCAPLLRAPVHTERAICLLNALSLSSLC